MHIILALGRQRQKSHDFEVSLDYTVRLFLKKFLKAGHWWLILVILAIWEAENRFAEVDRTFLNLWALASGLHR
jgi:hypothetical protein